MTCVYSLAVDRLNIFVSFFFQAEDGIRDTSVTGVQTCALPISDGRQGRELGVPPHGDFEHVVGSQHVSSRRDRKSTRLNSSHRCISYAVFCLKKKKK